MLPGVAGDSAGGLEGCGAMGAIVAAVYCVGAVDPDGDGRGGCASERLTVVLPLVYPCDGLGLIAVAGGVEMVGAAIAFGVVTVVGVGRGTPVNCGEAAALEGVWAGDIPVAPGLCA